MRHISYLFSPVRMDSFFLAEMFKYLFLLFADNEDLPFDVEDYVFTTEAHLLPLSLSTAPHSSSIPSNRTVLDVTPLQSDKFDECIHVLKFLTESVMIFQSEEELDDSNFDWTCPNTRLLFPDPAFPRNLREPIRTAVDKSCPRPAPYRYVYLYKDLTSLHASMYYLFFSSFTASLLCF